MRLILDLFRRHPAQCLIVWACLIVGSIAEGASVTTLLPILTIANGQTSDMVDEQTQDIVTQTLHWLSINPTLGTMLTLVVLGLVLKAALTLIGYRQVGYTSAAIATEGRVKFLRALSVCQWAYVLNQRSGKLSNAISMEASKSAEVFQRQAELVALTSQSVVFFIAALLIHWEVALAAIGIGALIFGVLKFLVSISRQAGSDQNTSYQEMLALLGDALASLKPLKSMARERQLNAMLERQAEDLNRALRSQVLAKETLKSIQELLIGLVLIAGVGGALMTWDLKMPEIMVLTLVLARMLSRLGKIQQEFQKLVAREAYYWSMQENIREAEINQEAAFGNRTPSLEHGISVENVSFDYGENRVLSHVDLWIPANEFTTLVGFSGAGKTTMVDLIIGLLRADEGRILMDDAPVDELDIRAWRSMIGYVPQDTTLLHDTIYNNVIVGDHDISEQAAERALAQAGAGEFINSLENGIHTNVGEHGGMLSGGQRQRIVIARALVHEPELLILDEATSSLDPETEAEVSATLANLKHGYTVLAISHRAALTRRSTRVYELKQGRAALANVEDYTEA